jgi:hypothetical protein
MVIAKMIIGMDANAPKEDMMKKTFLIALFLLIGIALAFPQPGYSRSLGWYGPAIAVGAGAALLGAVIGGPGYGYYGPQVAYGYPRPAYGYAAPAYGRPYYGPRHSGYRYYGSYAGRGHYGHRW